MSWALYFNSSISLGELLQIGLALVGLVTGASVWVHRARKQREPLWVRLRDNRVHHLRTARLGVGVSQIRLVLYTRVPRHSGWYQFELMERDWQTIRLAWVATQTPTAVVGVSDIRVHVTNFGMPLAQGSGTGFPPASHVLLHGPAHFCAVGELAIIELTFTATAPWKGGLRIEAGAAGEATKRVVLPVAIT